MIQSRRSPCKNGDGRQTAAFTLVELLVSMAVLSILLALIFNVMSNSTSIAVQATRQMDASRVARESLDFMGRELSEASMPLARASQASLQLSVDAPNILPAAAGGLSYMNPDYIFWQTPRARNRTYGDMAIIGYFVLQDMQNSTDPTQWRLQLRRVYVEPENPNNTVNYQIYTNSSIFGVNYIVGNTWPAAVLPLFSPTTSGSDNNNAQRGWVADGVFGMWIRCLDRYGNPITKIGDTNNGIGYTRSHYESRWGYLVSGTCKYLTAMPGYVEVALACMAPSDVARVTTLTPPPLTVMANFFPTLDNSQAPLGYIQNFRAANPKVKSAGISVRRIRLYGAD